MRSKLRIIAMMNEGDTKVSKIAGKGARKSSANNQPEEPCLSADELYAMGKKLRDKCPRKSHAVWREGAKRPDPLHLLELSNKGRIPELIPIRHGRMMRTPFTYYRGAALNMADDLATTAISGLRVQACGDAHLMNFGAFATPERRVIFDINDLDETLPAPWEWDVKRLAASFVVACRNNGFSEGRARDTARACVHSYRKRMAEFGKMRALDVWYTHIDLEDLIAMIEEKQASKRIRKRLAAARHRSVMEHDFPKLAAIEGRTPAIKDNPPLIFHPQENNVKDLHARAQDALPSYRKSMEEDRRVLLNRYKFMDTAIKVVGVGSVGTYCAVVLLMAGQEDPLFLQIKEARASVLEAYAGRSVYPNHGQRVVNGCRLMQSASDIFLGWTKGELGRHFYVRQLKDMKISPLVELFTPVTMLEYADVCGWALARAHARSGEPAKISGYLGRSDAFDKAITKFSITYADRNERDYEVLRKAVRAGRVEVEMESE